MFAIYRKTEDPRPKEAVSCCCGECYGEYSDIEYRRLKNTNILDVEEFVVELPTLEEATHFVREISPKGFIYLIRQAPFPVETTSRWMLYGIQIEDWRGAKTEFPLATFDSEEAGEEYIEENKLKSYKKKNVGRYHPQFRKKGVLADYTHADMRYGTCLGALPHISTKKGTSV